MWHDNETCLDFLGYQHFAETIISLTKTERLLPVTIGLFGDWGSGKSSILKMVEKTYSDDTDSLCLRFDGWLFEGYDDAKAALMTDIIQAIMEKAKANETLTEKTKSLLKRVDWFRLAGLAAKGVVSLTTPLAPLGAITSLLGQVPSFAEKFSEDPTKLRDELESFIKPEVNEVFENIRQFRSEFEDLIAESGLTSVVILIDDLDRCLPESIISTLEAIKLFLSVKQTAFVIAADEGIIRHAINNRYPTEKYDNQDLSQDYLEKLIQIPITLPVLAEQDVACYLYMLFAEKVLCKEHREEFEKLCHEVQENKKKRELPEAINYGIAAKIVSTVAPKLQKDFALVETIAPTLTKGLDGNPRLIKRFLNTLSLRLFMSKALNINLHENILCKLMILERFHEHRFKELFAWQSAQQGMSSEIATLEDAIKNNSDKDLSDDEKIWFIDEEISQWLKTEPLLANECLSEYFYICRETIRISTKGSKQLPPELQKIFANLQSSAKLVQVNAAKKLAALQDEDIFSVYEALISKAITVSGRTALQGLIETALLHELLAARLITDLNAKVDPASLNAKIVFRLASIRQKHIHLNEPVNSLLVKFTKSSNKEVAKAATAALKPSVAKNTRGVSQRSRKG